MTLRDALPEPGGSLLSLDPAVLPKDARARDISGVLRAGVVFFGDAGVADFAELTQSHHAVVIAAGNQATPFVSGFDPAGEGLKAKDRMVACGSVVRGACSAVQAVADGRNAAMLVAGLPAAAT